MAATGAGRAECIGTLECEKQNLARTGTRDVELHGVNLPAGKKVLLGYAAANRDHRDFGPTVEDIDVERTISKILTLSYGTHYCIGAAAARLQARVVLEELLARCPKFQVDVDAGIYARGAYVRRHLTLPWTCPLAGRFTGTRPRGL